MGGFQLVPRARAALGSTRVQFAALAVGLLGFACAAASWHATTGADEPQADEDSLGQVELSVSPDFSTLQFNGPIVFGITRRVRDLLDAYPTVTTLRLTSPGGRVVEARALSELVAGRNLTTLAAGNCASACTVLFMAGRDRLLEPSTTLGFHRYHSPDPAQVEAEANMAIDRRYFSVRGIPDWFIDRAFTTPNTGMWRPTLDDMKLANVITGEVTAEGRRTAPRRVDYKEAGPPPAERVEGGLSVKASEAR